MSTLQSERSVRLLAIEWAEEGGDCRGVVVVGWDEDQDWRYDDLDATRKAMQIQAERIIEAEDFSYPTRIVAVRWSRAYFPVLSEEEVAGPKTASRIVYQDEDWAETREAYAEHG